MLAQFPPRLLLAGAVVTALTASTGTVLTFPTATPAPLPQLPQAPAPGPAQAAAAPVEPAVVDGAQIASLAAPPAPAAAPTPAPAPRKVPVAATPQPDLDPDRRGLSEDDWARLPAGLRDKVRLACEHGYLSGAHCENA